MAYSKKTWKARQGLGLNKFSIDGATPVPVINQPDSVTQQGDALSAGNLNNLENRIANAFDDVENEKADKATTDDLQSQIVNLNTDVDTLDAIVGCEAEIENTDPSEGQSILASSRLIHHVNLLPSGEFGLVGARDVKWNQLVQNGNFADGTDGWTRNGGQGITAQNNILTFTSSASGSSERVDRNSVSFINGHTYYISVTVIASRQTKISLESNQVFLGQTISANTKTVLGVVVVSNQNQTAFRIFVNKNNELQNGDTVQLSNVNIFDLTAMGMASLTADQFRALFPASYYPYDAGSIVNLNPTGFSIRGINLWDEHMEIGIYLGTTGEPADRNDRIRCVNRISVIQQTQYYVKASTSNTIYMRFYDINDGYLGESEGEINQAMNSAFTVPQGAFYMRFYLDTAYGTTYLHDVQICLNSLPSSVKTVYHPFSGQTVPVSISGHYVNENCYDYVTNKTVDGVLRGEVHTRVGVVDLGTMTWVLVQEPGYNRYYAPLTSAPVSSTDSTNLLCAKYEARALLSQGCMWLNNGNIHVVDNNYSSASDFKTAMDGVTLYYELATESVTYTEPLRSFYLTDYATIEPIIPQTLPNRVDVPFSVLSKSNNGLIEQIRTNTADIADNKQILSQHEARISNLEQVSGDYVTEDMQDYSAVPTGKASFALVETLKGVSRVENQLAPDKTSQTINGITFTVDNNNHTITMSGTATANASFSFYPDSLANGFKGIVGHKYLLYGQPFSEGYFALFSNGGFDTSWQSNVSPQGQVLTSVDSTIGSGLILRVLNGNTINRTVSYPVFCDLTVYFNGNIPSNADTVAHIAQYYPELLEPRSYNAGEIVDSTYTKVESVGANRLNPTEFKANLIAWGGTDNGDGTVEISASLLQWKIIWENTTDTDQISIYLKGSNPNDYSNLDIIYSDGTNSSLSIYSNGGWTTSAQGKRVERIEGNWYSGMTIFSVADCGIFLGSTSTWSDYFTDQLAIPSVTLKGAGSVSDELDVESGEITRRIATVDLGSLTWSTDSLPRTGAYMSGIIKPVSNSSVANVLCPKYIAVSRDDVDNYDKAICVNVTGILIIRDTAFTGMTSAQISQALSGVYVNIESLASTTESVTPVLNNTLKTEGGGSVYTDADVDGQFTMGFLNL